jgi:hypothetical protein
LPKKRGEFAIERIHAVAAGLRNGYAGENSLVLRFVAVVGLVIVLMGRLEADRQTEGPLLRPFLQKFDRLIPVLRRDVRDAPVRLLDFVMALAAVGRNEVELGFRNTRANSVLADKTCMVARGAQNGRIGFFERIGRQRALEIENAVPTSILAGQEACAARRTDGCRHASAVEDHALAPQSIDVRSWKLFIAVDAQSIPPLVVGE